MTVAVRIIPCLDIRAGRVVKGVNFENIIDAGDPVETAERYNTEGADELCFLDIDASYENRSATLSTVEAVASHLERRREDLLLSLLGQLRHVVDGLPRVDRHRDAKAKVEVVRPHELVLEVVPLNHPEIRHRFGTDREHERGPNRLPPKERRGKSVPHRAHSRLHRGIDVIGHGG